MLEDLYDNNYILSPRADFLKSIKTNKASKKIRLNFTLKEMRLVKTNKYRWYHG